MPVKRTLAPMSHGRGFSLFRPPGSILGGALWVIGILAIPTLLYAVCVAIV
jgi:hypothetical protein